MPIVMADIKSLVSPWNGLQKDLFSDMSQKTDSYSGMLMALAGALEKKNI